MARIIYGVHSDGMGHYPRSKTIIDHLISNGHQVKILTANRPYKLFKYKYDVERVYRIATVYKNNGIDYGKTVQDFLFGSSKRITQARAKVKEIFEKFEPDLVISDTEMFSAKTAISKKIPVIYIANGYSLSHTIATGDLNRIFKGSGSNIAMHSPNSKYVKNYMILSFFKTKIKENKKGTLIPPLIREEIINAKTPKQKDHILVYQTTNTNKKLPEILKQIPNEKFIIYGFHKNLKDKNLTFKKNSIKNDFFQDLLTCKAIITNGGFSLISEGLFLHKPILSNPLKGQVEQLMNAIQLDKLKFGKYVKTITTDLVKSFLYDLDYYKDSLKNYKQKNNTEAFEKIDKEIELALKQPIYIDKNISKEKAKKIRERERERKKLEIERKFKKSLSKSSASHNSSKSKKNSPRKKVKH